MKTFQKVQIFNVVKLMPCCMGTGVHAPVLPFSCPRCLHASSHVSQDPLQPPHLRKENVNMRTKIDSRKGL